jgi:hypothetical protein
MVESKPSTAGGGIATLVLLLILGGGCAIALHNSDDKSSPSTPAAPTRPADEQEALDAVALACSETPDKLDAEASKTVELLAEKGVHDETTVTVLQHLRKSIPDNAPIMDCTTVLGPYIMIRAGGN